MSSVNDISQKNQASSDPLDIIDDNAKSVLTYGSLIYLTFTEENLTEYYAYSEGLTKTKVLLRTKESFNREGSYMRGLFRIYPSFYHNEYIKAKAKFQEIMNGGESTQPERETRAQIPKLVKGISEELALNLDIYEKLKGTPVRYGQVIQLLHIGSQKYLAYDPESPSDLESDCLKIELKHENSDYTCFRIQPSFKYQQESQGYIYNDDIVYMMSIVDTGSRIFGDPYLHASRTIGALNKDNPNKENLDKKEINVSSDKKTQWKVKIFSDYVNEKIGVLSVGDIIWINLSEEDKNLIVHNSNDNENDYSFKFILCSSTDRYKKFVGNSNGMFIIENLNMAQGGLVQWQTAYRLKHLTTNKYLSIGPQHPWEIDERKENRVHSLKLVTSEKEAANFYFEILYSTISSRNKQFFLKYVPKDAYFKLRVENDLSVTYRDMIKSSVDAKEQYDDDYITIPLIGKTKENNIFHCSKATQNEMIVTMFLISCKNTIKNTLKYLDPEFMNWSEPDFQQLQLKHKVVTYKLERMKACLKQLELFCQNKLLDYLSVDQSYGQANTFIQNTLKEQFFIELLAYTLIICFPKHQHLEELKRTERTRKDRKEKKGQDHSVNLLNSPPVLSPTSRSFLLQPIAADGGMDKQGRFNEAHAFTAEIIEDINHKKKRICELSYKLIMAICDKNIQNKNYAYQYLAVFQMQAEYMSSAVDCVNIILKDNEELLLNLHKINISYQGNNGPEAAGSEITSVVKAISKRDKGDKKQSFGFIKNQAGSYSVKFTNPLTRSASPGMKEKTYENAYTKYYNQIAKSFQNGLTGILRDWEPIKFFAVLLQRTEDVENQKKLLHFFKTISLQGQEGININQEIIFKYFTYSNGDGHTIIDMNLLKLFTQQEMKLCVKVPFPQYSGKEYELKEFLETNDGADRADALIGNYLEDDSSEMDWDLDVFERVENRNLDLLTNHIDLCAALCQSRNFSWKNRFENEITWDSLMSYLLQELPAGVKASLNRLMTCLYIDQEPRREITIPQLCRVVDKKKLALMESNKNLRDDLYTIATSKSLELKEAPSEKTIQKFKIQLLGQIEQLENFVKELPLELKKENMLTFEKKITENWQKAYNYYVLELVQTLHLMLKFNKIKIQAKRISITKLPKTENTGKKRFGKKDKGKTMMNFGIGIGMNLNIPNFSNFNLFKQEKKREELTEFENIMRSLMLLLEYDKTYPEAKKTLIEMRDQKRQRSEQEKDLLSAKKMFNRFQGIANFAKNLIIDTKANEKKQDKKAIDLDFLDKELATNEIYLKQGDVMKRILQNLLGQQVLDIGATIKIKILDILEYFFEYKQDKLLGNVRRVFYEMVKEAELVDVYRGSQNEQEVNQAINEILPHYMKFILPRILLTGTETDEQDVIFKNDAGEDILDINEILDFELLPVLLQQLCLNSNSLFEIKILHLMTRMYNQREDFKKNIKNLLLLFEQANIQNYSKAKKIFMTLQKNAEASEKWLTGEKLDEQTLLATKDILLFFYDSLFVEDPLLEEDEEQQTKFDANFLDTRPISRIRQDMYRHMKIYIPIISLIKDNIHIVEGSTNENVLDLFRICFAFLTGFVKNNEENQLLLANSLIVFIYNINSNLGHVRLLVELFRNNMTLCTTKVEEVIDDFCRLICSNGRKAEYLDFFEVIQSVNDEALFPNQRMVLDLFLDAKQKNTLLYFDNPVESPNKSRSPLSVLKPSTFVNAFTFSEKFYKFDEPFYYHAKLFDVLGLTARGKEGLILNEIRLRSILDWSYLLQLLLNNDNFSSSNPDDHLLAEAPPKEFEILKIPVAKYIFYVYLESDKAETEISRQQTIMKSLVDKEKTRIDSLKHYKPSYLAYLFDHLLPIFSWYYRQIRQNKGEEEAQEIKKEPDELLQFVDVLITNLYKFDALRISQAGRENTHALLALLERDQKLEIDVNLLQGAYSEQDSQRNLDEVKKNLPEEEVWKKLWEHFIVVFEESKVLEDVNSNIMEIDKEKKIFAKALTHIDKMFKKNVHIKEIINNEEVIKKFVNFVINSENKEETKATVILILDALRNLIENEKEEPKIVERQNFLNRNNAVYMIFSKLSDPNLLSSDEVFRKLIHFAIKFLEGGNTEVQKNIYKHFTTFSNSEVFFLKIHERFISEIQTTKKLRENLHHKIMEEEIDEMKDILRLLQLFAEGHFTDLQNYMRFQTNSYHSYDMLADISDLLNAYMQAKHNIFFDTMIQCFDTITEFIQGPCFENQVAVLQGSFLDLASNLLSVDELAEEKLAKDKKQKDENNNLKKWQLARLKHKCSITLLSLLEARKNENNVYRMMKSLPREVLRRNITDIYFMFQSQYKGNYTDDVFLHFNHDPDDEHSEEYCSLIIETGFNLYFLLNIFSEAKLPGDEDDLEQDNQDDEGEKNMLNDNILMKWFKLLISLVKTSLNAAEALKNNAVEQGKKMREMLKLNSSDDDDDEKNAEFKQNLIILELIEKRTKGWTEASVFFRNNTANIEVLREDNHLEKTYFYKLPCCHAITKDTKNKFNNEANRSSAKAKCAYLLKQSSELSQVIKHEYRLQNFFNRIGFLSLLTKNIMLWRDTAFLLAITINCLILASYSRQVDQDFYHSDDLDQENVITVLGCILLVLSSIIVLYFMLKTAPLLIAKAWKGTTKSNLTLSTIIINSIKTFLYLLNDSYVLYYLFYGFSAIIGLSLSPFFFSLHLLDVLVRFPLLQNVLKSIWIPRKPLLLTFLLFQMLNYFFTLIGYFYFSDLYGANGQACPNTWICFLTAVDKSFKVDGGLGGYLQANENMEFPRFLFDNLYNLLVMIIMLNIVAGIIIDNFGTLREEEKKFQYDIQNICFICGNDRETLEKASEARGGTGGSGFNSHIRKDHYLWNYLFYIIYILNKEKTEYTGLESYIAEQIENEDISWFPTHRALILKGFGGSEDSNDVAESLKKIEEEQRGLMKDASQLSKNIYNLEDLVKKQDIKIKGFSKHTTMKSVSSAGGLIESKGVSSESKRALTPSARNENFGKSNDDVPEGEGFNKEE